MIKKFQILIVITVILIGILTSHRLILNHVNAASGFNNLIAQINSNVLLNATQMTVRFNLPFDSPPIRKSDYIQIYLADFSNLTVPTNIYGDYAGSPITSVDGQYVRITNIRVQPGGYVDIAGINLTNPGDENLFQVIVMVTEDENATLVKNFANVRATLNYGSVTITASIPYELATLVISGFTGPNTFLIFSQETSVLGTDSANSLGQFLKTFSGLQPTTHNITFYGVDSENRATSPIPISIYTPAYQQTQISNQLLSPTIEINSSLFLHGDPIHATGSAIPDSDITLFTDNPLRSYQATSDSSGDWTYTITDSDQYVPGDYRIYAIAQNQYGLQSLTSPSIFFSMRTSQSSGTACGDITQGDLNCDGNVDLTDFSVLMYYWSTNNAAADVNGDEIVNLTDFSVLMYYWGT